MNHHLFRIVIALILGIGLGRESLCEEKAPAVSGLPRIVIHADPLEPSVLEYGKPISVLSEEEIENRSATTLGEALRLEPGVRSSFFGQGASRPVLRGFGGDRVRVLKNGVTTGDVSDVSEDHVVAADPLQAQHIEVLRGPETLLYGSGAIGGAVNVEDGSIPETAASGSLEGRLIGQLGNSADKERTTGVKLRGGEGAFQWTASGFYRETDDYAIPGYAESERLRELEAMEHSESEDHDEPEDESLDFGRVSNSDTQSYGASLGGSYLWDDGFWGVAISGFSSDYGVPGHAHAHEDESHSHEDDSSDFSGEDESVRIDAQQVRVDMRGRIENVSDSISALKFRVGLADYEHDEIEGGSVSTSYKRNAIETRVELLHSLSSDVEGAVGVQLLYDDFSALGEEAFLVPVKTLTPALFAFENLHLGPAVEMRFGGRVEAVDLDPEGSSSKTFVPFSASAGPFWNITEDQSYSLGMTFSYAQRAPNAVELFSDGQHLARQIYEIGSRDLGKESSWGLDVAFQKNDGFLTGAFTPFYQNFGNYINLASTEMVINDFPVYQYEEVEAYFWGFELETALHVDKLIDLGEHGLVFEHQLDVVRARDSKSNEHLPRIPPLRNIARGRYSYADLLQASVEAVFVQQQDRVAPLELGTDSYALLNTELSYTLPAGDIKLFARGSNLTNDEARIHSSFLKDLAPLRGRSFVFGVRAAF